MVLSETVVYVSLLGVTLAFSAFALASEMHRMALKIIAGLCWFVMALTQFFFLGGSALLAAPLSLLYVGFGLVFCFSMVTEFNETKRRKIWDFD